MGKLWNSGKAALMLTGIATGLAGCSTGPRNFAASVSTPVPDRAAFEQDYRTCDVLVKAGHSSNFKGVAASGLAGVAGTLGTTAAFATAGGIGIGGATTAASLAIPGVGILAAFGISRAIRGGNERKFKRNMAACLGEYGYQVADWEKLHKREDTAAFASRQVAVAAPVEPDPVQPETVDDPQAHSVEFTR